jgi:hypothetical protein
VRQYLRFVQGVVAVALICVGVAFVWSLWWALIVAGCFILLDRIT